MSQQQRIVKLSAASLAVILCKDVENVRAGGEKHTATTASGQDIFADFKAQNLRSFWNKRLVNAVSEVHFQGWMENLVLFVEGNANNLEVLREAWMRRALRSPRGFVIKAVGDVSPVQMTPIAQSQFIPLSEVLCSLISDMNTDHITVNQEALITHMMKAHPGMTVPTQDILYNALGSLIKERKIYHTGEGYFIVTPQTYFITNNTVKEKNWWSTGENELPSPPPITYLVSNENCLDATGASPSLAHCKSCRCFTAVSTVTPSVQDHVSVSECTGKSLKWPKEHKPSVQHQSTSTAADCQASEISKATTTSRKDKEKVGRKFGLSLFRRSTAKKETKLKKEYATFSGQFPPEEWPVRDENDLNNLPRDLEHAIIKRINPELTVDNLVRHTALMMKLEERDVERAVDKGMSTEMLVSKPRNHSSKVAGKRTALKNTRSKRRGHSSKEKHRPKPKAPHCVDDMEEHDLTPSRLKPDFQTEEPENQNDSAVLNAKSLYKKRIENPFQGISNKDTLQTSSHREQRRRDGKTQTSGKKNRSSHRSKSWDPHHTKGTAEEPDKTHVTMEGSCEHLHKRELAVGTLLDGNPVKEHSGDYSSIYPESSTLRIEDKVKHLKENNARGRDFRQDKDAKHRTLDADFSHETDQRHLKCHGNMTDYHPLVQETTDIPLSWPKPSVRRRISLRQMDVKEDSSHRPDLLASHQQTGNMLGSQQLVSSSGQHRGSGIIESDVYTDDDRHLYMKSDVTDEDACSSLCLNEECTLDSSEAMHPNTIQYCKPQFGSGNWISSLDASSFYKEPLRVILRKEDSGWNEPNDHPPQSESSISLRETILRDGSPHRDKNLHKINRMEKELTDAIDSSIFDYCQTSEMDSDAETLQKSLDERENLSAHQGSESQQENCHQNLNLFDTQEPRVPLSSSENHSSPNGAHSGETTESQSNTGDSGIDSPRTRMSMTSSNSAILEGFKRRGFLQNIERLHSKSNGIHPQSSLLQLTPVMNV
ncbi:storkhead-box protein 1 [Alosa sapidissima]|uniref:storkhead-box protein 1 n=1 Tax=Alosa sapidissima TaxID=34773 RepID=UPI001C086319|nr:storkhead-box protein 1 [Alosa sapidissima]